MRATAIAVVGLVLAAGCAGTTSDPPAPQLHLGNVEFLVACGAATVLGVWLAGEASDPFTDVWINATVLNRTGAVHLDALEPHRRRQVEISIPQFSLCDALTPGGRDATVDVQVTVSSMEVSARTAKRTVVLELARATLTMLEVVQPDSCDALMARVSMVNDGPHHSPRTWIGVHTPAGQDSDRQGPLMIGETRTAELKIANDQGCDDGTTFPVCVMTYGAGMKLFTLTTLARMDGRWVLEPGRVVTGSVVADCDEPHRRT